MFEKRELELPGCFEIRCPVHRDERGCFVKTFQLEAFTASGLDAGFSEDFVTTSPRGVLRGLHFQTPPYEQTKLVYCLSGSIFDVVVDLRVGSPAYGRYVSLELDAEQANGIYLPPGIAHGFCVTGGEAVVAYKVSTSYVAANDEGIRWDSVGVSWPTSAPVVSARDRGFRALTDFVSPFVYEG